MITLALPWLALVQKLGIGFGGAASVYLGRRLFNWFDFLPRRLHSLSIGTYFGYFTSTAPGDQNDAALFIDISNKGGHSLYLVRAVYIPGHVRLPIYVNARRSQKKTRGYELKFGPQWKDLETLVAAGQSANTYLPLSECISDNAVVQGQRGNLYLEYVLDGRTGVHFAPI